MSASHIVGLSLAFLIWVWAMAERYFRHQAEKDRDYLRSVRDEWSGQRYDLLARYEALEERYQRSARAWRRMAKAYLALQYATLHGSRSQPERAPVPALDPSRSITKSCSCNDLRRAELAEGETP